MENKERLLQQIARAEYDIKTSEDKIERTKKELEQLHLELKRQGPRKFVLRKTYSHLDWGSFSYIAAEIFEKDFKPQMGDIIVQEVPNEIELSELHELQLHKV